LPRYAQPRLIQEKLTIFIQMLVFPALLCELLLALIASAASGESFYDLLGVSTDDDLRTIRKAFKKMALLKHPDKNQDDPNAHSVFVRINRAYEVLKDEELRKKYDEHGEEGLTDGFQQQSQQYQSWTFYRDNFGVLSLSPSLTDLSYRDLR